MSKATTSRTTTIKLVTLEMSTLTHKTSNMSLTTFIKATLTSVLPWYCPQHPPSTQHSISRESGAVMHSLTELDQHWWCPSNGSCRVPLARRDPGRALDGTRRLSLDGIMGCVSDFKLTKKLHALSLTHKQVFHLSIRHTREQLCREYVCTVGRLSYK